MRFLLLVLAAATLAGSAFAAPTTVKPAPEALVRSVKAFLATPAGAKALASRPGLAAIGRFDPAALTDRLRLGPVARRLPENFALLEEETLDWATFEPALDAATADLDEMFAAEAKGIAASVAQGKLSVEELRARAHDLETYSGIFSFYGPIAEKQIAAVSEMARAAREKKTLAALQGMAAELLGPEADARVAAEGATLSADGALLNRKVSSQKELDALAESDPPAAYAAAKDVLLQAGGLRNGSSLLSSAMDVVGRAKTEDSAQAMLHVLERSGDHMARRDAARFLGESGAAASPSLREKIVAELQRHATRPILQNVDFSLAEMAKAALAKLGVEPAAAPAVAEASGPAGQAAQSEDAARAQARAVLAMTRVRFPELPERMPLPLRVVIGLGNVLVSTAIGAVVGFAGVFLFHVVLPINLVMIGWFLYAQFYRSPKKWAQARAKTAELNAAADAAEKRVGFPISAAGKIPRTPQEDADARREFEAFSESFKGGGKPRVVIFRRKP